MLGASPATRPSRSDGAESTRWRTPVLLFLRRAHLYTGLFMLPFVFLYGASALVFNHPSWFGRGEPAERVRGVATLPDARSLAPAVVAALGSGAELVDARWQGDLVLQVGDRQVRLDPVTGDGTSRPGRKRAPPAQRVPVDRTLLDKVKEDAAKLGAASIRQTPQLRLSLLVEGKPWTATWNLETGAVESAPTEPLATSQVLTRLHVAHGYGGRAWLWGACVDATALVLLFWGASGLALWLSLRGVRRSGLVTLAASLAVAALVLRAMLG